MTAAPSFDALLPAEMARKAEQVGIAKARLAALPTLVLAVLAGSFIAMGAVFATTVSAGAAGVVPYGVARPPGTVFLSFHWRESPANALTHAFGLDPRAKIPELKVCGVRLENPKGA